MRRGTYLPRDLPNPPIYSKVNPADAPILTLALTSDTLPLSKVEDLADTQLAQKISQLHGRGAGDASAAGRSRRCAIQANPTALASNGLSMEDVRSGAGCRRTWIRRKGSLMDRGRRIRSARTISCCRARTTEPLSSLIRMVRAIRLKDVANVVDGVGELTAGRVDERRSRR